MARRLAISVLLVLGSFLAVPYAQSQDGSARVVVGDGGDLTRSGTYGGVVSAGSLASECVGYIPSLPQVLLDVVSDGWIRITIEAEDGVDTTLMLRGPADTICNDDANENTLNPEIATYLTAGEYSLYVGGLTAMEEGDFSLSIRHGGRAVAPELTRDRPMVSQGVSGGLLDASAYGQGCIGSITANPSHTFLIPRRMYIQVAASSSSDLTLVVQGANVTLCNDDGIGTLDPVVQGWFPEGLVQVYVGSHNPRVSANYIMTVQSILVSERGRPSRERRSRRQRSSDHRSH